ncbi:hypothetical protein ONS95_010362 [Cadophora gregata]|uniref:uncharacterized protein n=1 Tax=Cadophora gregata TaxID=51156 RepID=UPI0026DAA670|nr:uncharacterized protein ONS95_010362 [Cadophora gregata]KAK0122100.1 hypothetical protein ONS95_010362 [Cadophora gregata]KAK0127574.1 hypothetical protein ONS96_007105 [Cadophora gregata f. sp. sojae]
MYYRVFPVRSMKIGGCIIGGITSLWTITILFVTGFQCMPLEKFWRPWVAGRCFDTKIITFGLSIPNIITDIAILTLPLPQIWRMNADIRQKSLLSAVFLLGSLATATSVYRLVVSFMGLDIRDIPYTISSPCIWSMIDLSSGIMSACLPTMVSYTFGINVQTGSGVAS